MGTVLFSPSANFWRLGCPLTGHTSQAVEATLAPAYGRVEMWRGICRSDISVSASFVWRCLSGPTMAPFPHPAHRTGRADFPHPALGQDLTPLFWRATP